ncbi:hypothetical protein CNMCM5793_002893 [Aspergillus hiratsukae]|uniref:HNH nuclease domain-containing protein n=1 Tax=Aspergillus hiratsukae TaxID=1194566 RepID=A0A8H6UIF1_9EURO|nr:hypothetical protein CNMCM5793_002893 [Aspergillus hiratsukae]KAF7155983.1 hypothetical protein CNMCM6106_008419 [Aspergillus hiratsukae]
MATIPLPALKFDADWFMWLFFVAVMFYITMNSATALLLEMQRGYNPRHAAPVAPVAPAAPVTNHYYGNNGCNCVGSANNPSPAFRMISELLMPLLRRISWIATNCNRGICVHKQGAELRHRPKQRTWKGVTISVQVAKFGDHGISGPYVYIVDAGPMAKDTDVQAAITAKFKFGTESALPDYDIGYHQYAAAAEEAEVARKRTKAQELLKAMKEKRRRRVIQLIDETPTYGGKVVSTLDTGSARKALREALDDVKDRVAARSQRDDGKDPRFEDWLLAIKQKLNANADHYPNPIMRITYGTSRTEGNARKHITPRLREDAVNPYQDASDLLKHLENVFADPNRDRVAKQNARRRGSSDKTGVRYYFDEDTLLIYAMPSSICVSSHSSISCSYFRGSWLGQGNQADIVIVDWVVTSGEPSVLGFASDTRRANVADIVYSGDTIELTDEACVLRIISQSESGREECFRKAVRARDQGCVLIGEKHYNSSSDDWTGWHAAHVFPLEKESLFMAVGFDRHVAGDRMEKAHLPINSCKNGILIFSHVHSAFDKYLLAINPDDEFRITVFGIDYAHCDGRQLDPACRDPNDPECVSTELLRWHFRQAVLVI